MQYSSTVIDDFIKIGFLNFRDLEHYHPCVRDDKYMEVLKCRKTGVIALSTTKHITHEYYESRNVNQITKDIDVEQIKTIENQDNLRRTKYFNQDIVNKVWLDIGTGTGLILEMNKDVANKCIGIEPHKLRREIANKNGLDVKESLSEIEDNSIEVVTLFHVFEHILIPVEFLSELANKIIKGGKIILEVPHANDFLMNRLDCIPAKDFLLWSEHLILHTESSLRYILEHIGFKDIKINGYQRYGLSNHLYWLRHGKPGGQQIWSDLNQEELDEKYSEMLCRIQQTDTLIATAYR